MVPPVNHVTPPILPIAIRDELVTFETPPAVATVEPFTDNVIGAEENAKAALTPLAGVRLPTVAECDPGSEKILMEVVPGISSKYLLPTLLPLSICAMPPALIKPLTPGVIRASEYRVPADWLNQLLKFVPVMLAASALRVTDAATVGM